MNEGRRFLLGSGLVLLLVGVAVWAFARRESAHYPPDDPRQVVVAYLQALERRDYEQAYTYWDARTWPDEQTFVRLLKETVSWRQDYAVTVGSVAYPEPDQAVVLLHLTQVSSPPLLFPADTFTVETTLTRVHGLWRLSALDPPWGPARVAPLPPPPQPSAASGE